MVSNLFSIRFDDPDIPAAEVALPGREEPVRDYLAGPENGLLAHVLADNFAPDCHQQPLVLFGPGGVGKTHVLRGIVDRQQGRNRHARVKWQTGSDFCRELAQAHELDALADLRQELRELDLFALDDVHRLVEKPYAQQELLTLLDILQDRGATTVLTSRLPPAELPFPAGLRSRLGGGLTVPIRFPELPTRSAFVRQVARELAMDLPEPIVDVIARTGPASIPELRGLMLQLNQAHLHEERPFDTQLVADVARRRAGEAVPTVREIIRKVARYFGLTVAELTGPSRRQTTVLARDTAIFLTRHLRQDSFEQIGNYFGGRDHSTIMHAFQKITKKRNDTLVNGAIDEIVKRLGMQHHKL